MTRLGRPLDPPELPDVDPGTPPTIREPDLPRTARERRQGLRTGYTTGACAAAAAAAATLTAVTGTAPTEVRIPFPNGSRHRFVPAECRHEGGDRATAVVIKDAGDDPDVTHGAALVVTVTLGGPPHIDIRGGEGVGVVTRPGLGLLVGAPAINPVPRRMIARAVTERLPEAVGARVEVAIPDGDRLARRTTNRRLGIVGGLSVLGTTGIVRPFSTAAWRAAVLQAVDVAAACGAPACVFSTGGRTERAAMRLLSDLEEVCFVEVGDFIGAAVRRCVRTGIPTLWFVAMPGKLTKVAAGVVMTHYTRSRVDLDLLAGLTAAVAGPELAARVAAANTARHAYELWQHAGIVPAVGTLLCRRAARVLDEIAGGAVEPHTALVDPDLAEVVVTDQGGVRR